MEGRVRIIFNRDLDWRLRLVKVENYGLGLNKSGKGSVVCVILCYRSLKI